MSGIIPQIPTTSTKSLRNRDVSVDLTKPPIKRGYRKRKNREEQVDLEVQSDSEVLQIPAKRRKSRSKSVSPDIIPGYLLHIDPNSVRNPTQTQVQVTQPKQSQASPIFKMAASQQFTAENLTAMGVDPTKINELNAFMQTQLDASVQTIRVTHAP
ncbi:MAG: hypothetical protein V4547_17405, partial [Bacteroidota bacterium]